MKWKKYLFWISVTTISLLAICLGIHTIGTAIRDFSLTYITITDKERDEMFAATNNGYGFPYENGWSSVDLRPYHVENPRNKLIRLNSPATFTVANEADMPILDGAEAAFPVYSAFALNCYENIADIEKKDHFDTGPIRFTNTIVAYEKLLSGEIDVFFGARPSAAQLKMAEEQNKTLKLTPLGEEAFVFFVSKDNPVNNLTADQIRKIYSGEYDNWKQVGGAKVPILAFQRPENSGSQTMMQYFMGDTPLKDPLEVEWAGGMGEVFKKVAEYQNKESSIGYSFRYYATKMENSYQDEIKFLSVNGISPTAENIANGTYPLTTSLYAITLEDNPKETLQPFLEWMQSEQGREIVERTGYVLAKG